jgi:hypothetical protein
MYFATLFNRNNKSLLNSRVNRKTKQQIAEDKLKQRAENIQNGSYEELLKRKKEILKNEKN